MEVKRSQTITNYVFVCLNPHENFHWILHPKPETKDFESFVNVKYVTLLTAEHGTVASILKTDLDTLRDNLFRKNIGLVISDHESEHHDKECDFYNCKYISKSPLPGVVKKEESNRTCWYLNEKLHNDNDKPAIVYKDGSKYWYKDGKKHRDEDKPAVIYDNGDKEWYCNGLVHRDNDRPAIIYVTGDSFWYKNGNLHRDNDQPAIIYANGNKSWYKDGYNYIPGLSSTSTPEDNPKIVKKEKEHSARWYLNDKLHNDNDEPAVVYKDGSKYWYSNGQLHRDGDEPAVILFNGHKKWYKNGKIHRDDDKPAVVYVNGDKQWYSNGNLHRDNDEPAIIMANGQKEWYKNGKRHRDGDKPAIIMANGQKEWYKDGNLHRDNTEPAIIMANGDKEWYKYGMKYAAEKYGNSESQKKESQIVKKEKENCTCWYLNDKLLRDGDNDEPAIVHANGDQYWYSNGNIHREGDKPAVVHANGDQYWYFNGNIHREGDKPAIVHANGDQYWYCNNNFHRDNDQPAIIYTNGNKSWYKDGIKYTPGAEIPEAPVQQVPGPLVPVPKTRHDGIVSTLDTLSEDEYSAFVEMTKQFMEKTELVRKGSKAVLTNLSKFNSTELETIVEKNPNQYSDLYSRFILGFVSPKYKMKIHFTSISVLVIGIIAQVEKKFLIKIFNKYNKEPFNSIDIELRKILKTILMSPNQEYPSPKDFVDMIYDKCDDLNSSVNMYILSIINQEQYAKIKTRMPINPKDLGMYYMLKNITL